MAKAPKTAAAAEPDQQAEVIPAPLASAVEEKDTVLQAHFTRQENHFADMAPSIAKKDREDKEREAQLKEHELIAERNRKERAAQAAAQAEREERENAAAKLEALGSEISQLEASLEDKKAEAARLKKLVKE